jgi:hypothetical protein
MTLPRRLDVVVVPSGMAAHHTTCVLNIFLTLDTYYA